MKRRAALAQGTIAYEEHGPADGEPLVFVHGFPANGEIWRDVAVPLAEAGYRCIVPDWPLGGHRIPMPRHADLTPPALAGAVADFLDRLDLQGVTLIGNDTGGALVQLVAADRPERLARIVVASSDVDDHFLPPHLRPVQWAARLPGAVRALGWALRVPAVQRLPLTFGWFTKQAATPEFRARLDGWLAPGRASRAIRRDAAKVLRGIHPRYTIAAGRKLQRFEKPALVVWAAEDRHFPPAKGRALAEALPDSRFRLIPDSYSYLPVDQPERLAQLIAEFCAATRVAR